MKANYFSRIGKRSGAIIISLCIAWTSLRAAELSFVTGRLQPFFNEQDLTPRALSWSIGRLASYVFRSISGYWRRRNSLANQPNLMQGTGRPNVSAIESRWKRKWWDRVADV